MPGIAAKGSLKGDVFVAKQLSRDPASGDEYRIFVDGDHSLRKSEAEVAEIVATWVAGIHLRG